ncbi:methylmalonyl-CoA epimerase [Adhaeribacter pallidiroseus]|uniref:Methylmalonyl-CoA epimerase n=1 Tax=Adhaeribacter pallidiroseus TaxID=2072847 RepID=A0A369QJ02_9BACT|nr:methylmalonyl-CoA epimerase [Adhaeribacter pallidiroseus]RDC63575.1 Methylmalonyl-CoA epimerase [Adhaeribacter pallidiroseus]
MNKVEHIGIAVKNLEKANLIYTQLLGIEPYKTEEVPSEQVITSFFRTGESKIELLAATDETSVIAQFILKKGEGMHHVAFAVDDIVVEMARLKQAGFTLLSETPKFGADNKLICFVHPKEANGVLIELCQERK